MEVFITDFTGVYDRQPFAEEPGVVRISCGDLGGTDCYCDPETEAELHRRIGPYTPEGLHYLDSGNYHYMTKLWTDKLRQPFSLVLFDHHTDMQPPAFGGLLSCGSWVRCMCDENPLLEKVCVVGVPETTIRRAEGPFHCPVLFGGEGERDAAWRNFLNEEGAPVYVSVDKDVLHPAYAATNWNQGTMTLETLAAMLRSLFRSRRVLGMDVCGEFRHTDDILSEQRCAALNDRANALLLRLFREYAG